MTSIKKFYKIGEVVEMTGLEPHILRNWQTECSQLNPKKNSSGHRVYSQADINLIEQLKQLVQTEGFTLAGAVKRLESGSAATLPLPGMMDPVAVKTEIREVRLILENMKKMLDRDA